MDQGSALEGLRCFAPQGRLDALTVPRFEEGLRDYLEQGRAQLVIDFGDVTYISSSGLRALLTARRLAKTSTPFRFGIIQSSTMASGRSVSTWASASCPSLAVTTRKPS